MDIECDSKNLDQVIRMLQREVHSVNYATNITGDEVTPMTPMSASFGKMPPRLYSGLINWDKIPTIRVIIILFIVVIVLRLS